MSVVNDLQGKHISLPFMVTRRQWMDHPRNPLRVNLDERLQWQ
jgi:hypothetical protein